MQLHHDLKNELIYMLGYLVLIVIILKIVFFNESFSVILKLSLSMFWLFALPGIFLMYFLYEKIGAFERFVIGTLLGMAYFTVIGYNLGLLGITFSLQNWILPVIAIILGIIALFKNKLIEINK